MAECLVAVAIFNLLTATNQKHSHAGSLRYLHVHHPLSVAQEEKKGGGRGGVTAAKGNESEWRGHRGVHHALICSTATGRGHAQLCLNMWEMETQRGEAL